MKLLKEQKAKEAKEKELLDRFPQVMPPDVPTEHVIVVQPQADGSIKPEVYTRPVQTPLERTIERLREQAQGL